MEARLSRRVVEVAPGISRVAPRRSVAQALLLGAEPVVLVALLALAVVARRPHYLLTHSFWLDEGWVVDSVRAPIGQLRLLTSSTPIGWTLLLRAVPPLGGPERYRLLPLAFGVATVPLAWMLARRLGRWGTVRAAVAAATAALVPASLARHDLKQYSAEGFVAVGVVLLVAWVEEGWSRRRLALLALLGAASILIANIAPLVVLGGLLALVLTAAARREWRHAAEASVAGVAVGSLHLLVYLAIARAGDNPAMRRWWLPDYIHLDNGLGPAARFAGDRVVAMLTTVGFGPWWLVLALVAAGVWSLARAGRPAAALLLPLLALELVVTAAAQRYPFLEVRTSLFVAVTVAVYAALGVAALVVNSAGTFPFAYYWPDQPTFVHTNQSTAVNFMVTYPDHPELVMVNGSRLGVAPAMARAHAAGARIWVIFAHGAPSTVRRWSAEAARYGHIEHPGPKALPLLVQPAR